MMKPPRDEQELNALVALSLAETVAQATELLQCQQSGQHPTCYGGAYGYGEATNALQKYMEER